MKTFARIENGVVAEIILPTQDDDGNEIPVEFRFPTECVCGRFVEVTDVNPMPLVRLWMYDGDNFSTSAAASADAERDHGDEQPTRDALISIAAVTPAPLQTAPMLDIATDEEKATATQWVQFTREVNAVDLTDPDATWPTQPAD